MFQTNLKTIFLAALLALGLTACPGDGKKKMEERQRKLDAAKESQKDKDAAKDKANTPVQEVVKLGAPWEDSAYVQLRSDGACPPNFWALFDKGEVPGATKEEKKANAAKRGELAKALREQTYFVKLRAPDEVKLQPFDAPKGEFPLEVIGTIDCTDSIGRVAITWSTARAGDPGNSAAKVDAEVTQNVWTADPLKFPLPMKGMADAKEFNTKHRLGMSARLFFKLGKVEVDKKLKKVAKVVEKAAGETLSMGGGMEDWGAGRMVKADGVGVRVAIEREKTALIERKP